VAADRVKAIGKISVVGKKCTGSGSTPTTTLRDVRIQAAKK
jgi:hypothetical protein